MMPSWRRRTVSTILLLLPILPAQRIMRAWLVLLGVLSLLPGLAASAEPVAESPLVTAANSSLLWGTYRPGLYFGLKPRIPDSLLSGLVWFGVHDWQSYTSEYQVRLPPHRDLVRLAQLLSADARHECDQRDGLQYSYTEHDGRSAAKEVIKDPLNNVQLTIRWLKVAGSRGEDGAQSSCDSLSCGARD